MYELFRKSGTLGVWQITYCRSDYKGCARYGEALQGKPVPLTLLPNGRSLGAP